MSSSQRSRRYVRRTSYAAESSGEEEDAASDFSLSDASVASDPSATQKTPSATQKTPSVARKTPSVIKKKKTSTPSTSKKQSDTKKPPVAKKSVAAKKKDPVVVTSKEPSKDTNKKSPDASPKETTKDAKPVQKKKAAKKKASTLAESYDIQTSDTNEYTLLIQVDPNQSLDLTGAVGAVGRFETDEEGVILDLKGRQYHGRIYPGPSALLLSYVHPKVGESDNGTAMLRVEGLTNEFCRLTEVGESAVQAVTTGDMSEYQKYPLDEDDVNRNRPANDEPKAKKTRRK